MFCLLVEIFIFRILAVSLDSIKIACARARKKRQERHFAEASKGTLDFSTFLNMKRKLFDPAVVRAVH